MRKFYVNFIQAIFLSLLSFNLIYSQFNEFQFDLSSKKINTSIYDSQGLFWIATDEGLNMFDGNSVHNFQSVLSENNSLLNSEIKSIIEFDKDLLLVGKDGISLFNREFFNYNRIKVPFQIMEFIRWIIALIFKKILKLTL